MTDRTPVDPHHDLIERANADLAAFKGATCVCCPITPNLIRDLRDAVVCRDTEAAMAEAMQSEDCLRCEMVHPTGEHRRCANPAPHEVHILKRAHGDSGGIIVCDGNALVGVAKSVPVIPPLIRAILEEDADEDCTAPDIKRAIRAFLASTAVSEPEGSRSSNPAPTVLTAEESAVIAAACMHTIESPNLPEPMREPLMSAMQKLGVHTVKAAAPASEEHK
jgi:hypothetical protein